VFPTASVNSWAGLVQVRAFRRYLAERGVKADAGADVLRAAVALVEDRVVAPIAA
jgi:tRNA-dihydrouridine synthase A